MGAFWKSTWDLLVKGCMMVSGFLCGAAAGTDGITLLLVGLMLTDYVGGVLAGAMAKREKYGWRALLKKALILLLVLLGYLLDRVANSGESMFRSAITLFYISQEAISLLDNLTRLGLPVPGRLKSMLRALGEEDTRVGEAPKEEATQEEAAQEEAPEGASPAENG